ncbi:MAG TPA: hypothetical protein VMW24_06005 [Sedimentisphaerales bacterium]|nr:hypothetical protein [Sedimentisphaerales bacterium]
MQSDHQQQTARRRRRAIWAPWLAVGCFAVVIIICEVMHRHNRQREVPIVYVEAEGPHDVCPIEDLVKIEREPRPLKIPCVTVENQND